MVRSKNLFPVLGVGGSFGMVSKLGAHGGPERRWEAPDVIAGRGRLDHLEALGAGGIPEREGGSLLPLGLPNRDICHGTVGKKTEGDGATICVRQ
jgi:hypothetical protein